MDQVKLIATAAFGLESVVAREIRQLGCEILKTSDGRVLFAGDASTICRANLWLRCADRVRLQIGEFDAPDFGRLFDQTTALPWSEILPVDAAFPVRGRSVKSQLHSVPHCQSVVKKAIVENLKRRYQRHRFEESGPEFDIEVSIFRDRAVLSVDTSGAGLHKRGYRDLVGPAPLRETLAAALVQLSRWNSERPLIDPFCGSGTIPIEAALIGRNRAPGLGRTFAAEDWPFIQRKLWREARTEARDLARGKLATPIIASDRDAEVLKLARRHVAQANVELDIRVLQRELGDLTTSRRYGFFICNPPYGQRLGERHDSEALCCEMRDVCREFNTWSLYVLTAQPQYERHFGRRADRRRKLYNGRIECTYYQFHGPPPPRSESATRPPSWT